MIYCSECGFEITDPKKPCPQCGHIMTEQEDTDNLITNMLEEDEFTPTFEDETEGETPSASETLESVFGPNGNVKEEKPKEKVDRKERRRERVKGLGDQLVNIMRFSLAAVIGLFVLSMFFNWLSLSGNGVNYGLLRDEGTQSFMYNDLEGKSIESLQSYNDALIVYSGMSLYRFSRNASEEYDAIEGPNGVPTASLASMTQRYYMMAMIFVFGISLVCLALVLVLRNLWGMAGVRNLAVVNFIIIGLNYLALRVPYMSMIAIKAKDVLTQRTEGYPRISMTMDGIAVDQAFYPYRLEMHRGFYFALIMLGLWLFISIILTEVRRRREEIAIEQTDV